MAAGWVTKPKCETCARAEIAAEVFEQLRASLAEMVQWCPAQRSEWMNEKAYEDFRNVRGRAVAALGRADAPSIKEALARTTGET